MDVHSEFEVKFYRVPDITIKPEFIQVAPIVDAGGRPKLLAVSSEKNVVSSNIRYLDIATDLGWRDVVIPPEPEVAK